MSKISKRHAKVEEVVRMFMAAVTVNPCVGVYRSDSPEFEHQTNPDMEPRELVELSRYYFPSTDIEVLIFTTLVLYDDRPPSFKKIVGHISEGHTFADIEFNTPLEYWEIDFSKHVTAQMIETCQSFIGNDPIPYPAG